MATLHNGRRPALIPSIESLSPEEVQDVLCNRIGRPVIPPPNPILAVSASHGQIDRQETPRLHKPPQPPSEAITKPDNARSLQKPDTKREGMASSSALSRGNADKSVRWTQAEEENTKDRHWKPDTITLGRESKRKHAVFEQDEQRLYSNEIWEDIPHMSEIESEHGFRTSAKDVFGLKGQKSLFAEDGHPKQAWLFQSRTARRPAFTPFHLATHPPQAHLSGALNHVRSGSSAAGDDSVDTPCPLTTPLGRVRVRLSTMSERRRLQQRGLSLHICVRMSNYIQPKHSHTRR